MNKYSEIRRLLVSFNKLHPFEKLPTSHWVGHRWKWVGLLRAPTRGGAPSQLLKKKKKKPDAPFPHPRPLAPHVCGWMQMIVIDGQLCPWKDISSPAPKKEKKKKMKTKPARHFQVGYIHNQRSIKTIYIYIFVVIKTDLSQQQPLKWLKCIRLYKNNNTITNRSQMPLQTINF